MLLGASQFGVMSSANETRSSTVARQGAESTAGRNVWAERREFYNSVVPRDSEDEERMLQAALELSKLEQHVHSLEHDVPLV